MRLVAVCLYLVPMLAWPCTQVPDRRYSHAENLRVAIEERFTERDWATTFQWATKAQNDDRTRRLPMAEQRRIRELGARAAIRLGRYTNAIEQLKALVAEANEPALEARLLEAQLSQAESTDALDEQSVNAAARQLRDGKADVDLQVALVPQLRRAKRVELVTTVCRDLERLEPSNVDVKRVCSGAPQPAKPPAPRQLGGCT